MNVSIIHWETPCHFGPYKLFSQILQVTTHVFHSDSLDSPKNDSKSSVREVGEHEFPHKQGVWGKEEEKRSEPQHTEKNLLEEQKGGLRTASDFTAPLLHA